MSRPLAPPCPPSLSGLPALSIAPAALADKLRRVLPQWVMGLEEPGLARWLALTAVGAGDADLAACGAGLALWSWQRAPFDPQRAEALQAVLPGHPSAKFAHALAPLVSGGPAAEDISALAAGGEVAALLKILMPRLRDPAQALPWLAPAWDALLRLETPAPATVALEACAWPPGTEALRLRLQAELAFLHGPEDLALSALDLLDRDPEHLFGAWAGYLRAEISLRAGDAAAGRDALAGLFRAMPWHANLGLKLHGLAVPPAPAPAESARRAAILVYSWNKAALVRQTLESLAATDVAGARVLALDNGSTDGTGEAMEAAARELFAPGVMRVVRLPVNIGAPAARNWLLAQPETRQSEYAVFLDDDVLLPERWLLPLLGALEADPRAGAAGCRIRAAAPPPCLQSADYQLFAPTGQPRAFRDLPENVNVFDNCAGALDVGLYTYRRPAAHVSGCCHALRTGPLLEMGGFDIRFSPTQFDDLDRDLRAAAAGRPAVYAGDVAVAHVQHSSLAKAKSAAATGQVMGNKIKLEGKHAHEEMATLAQSGLAALWEDLAGKWRSLGS